MILATGFFILSAGVYAELNPKIDTSHVVVKSALCVVLLLTAILIDKYHL
jgi:hypothetical protein